VLDETKSLDSMRELIKVKLDEGIRRKVHVAKEKTRDYSFKIINLSSQKKVSIGDIQGQKFEDEEVKKSQVKMYEDH
jgi:hypothetical protein